MSADPLAGDPADVRRIGRAFASWSAEVDDGAARVRGAGDTATTEWAGQAQEQFLATVEAMLPAARRVVGRIDAAAEVLAVYAEGLQAIQDDAERITDRRDDLVSDRAANKRARATVSALVATDDAV